MIFHRDSVAREVLATEQTYVQNLKIVLGVRNPNMAVMIVKCALWIVKKT